MQEEHPDHETKLILNQAYLIALIELSTYTNVANLLYLLVYLWAEVYEYFSCFLLFTPLLGETMN